MLGGRVRHHRERSSMSFAIETHELVKQFGDNRAVDVVGAPSDDIRCNRIECV